MENLRKKSCNTDAHVVLTICVIPGRVYRCTFHKVIENSFFLKIKINKQLKTRTPSTLSCSRSPHSNTGSSPVPPCVAGSQTSYLGTLVLLLSCLRQMFAAKVAEALEEIIFSSRSLLLCMLALLNPQAHEQSSSAPVLGQLEDFCDSPLPV